MKTSEIKADFSSNYIWPDINSPDARLYVEHGVNTGDKTCPKHGIAPWMSVAYKNVETTLCMVCMFAKLKELGVKEMLEEPK